jgi:hypothetical protein
MEVTERRRRAAVMAVTESIRQGPNRSFCDSDHQLRFSKAVVRLVFASESVEPQDE